MTILLGSSFAIDIFIEGRAGAARRRATNSRDLRTRDDHDERRAPIYLWRAHTQLRNFLG